MLDHKKSAGCSAVMMSGLRLLNATAESIVLYAGLVWSTSHAVGRGKPHWLDTVRSLTHPADDAKVSSSPRQADPGGTLGSGMGYPLAGK
jgi:hypothetical protein